MSDRFDRIRREIESLTGGSVDEIRCYPAEEGIDYVGDLWAGGTRYLVYGFASPDGEVGSTYTVSRDAERLREFDEG